MIHPLKTRLRHHYDVWHIVFILCYVYLYMARSRYIYCSAEVNTIDPQALSASVLFLRCWPSRQCSIPTLPTQPSWAPRTHRSIELWCDMITRNTFDLSTLFIWPDLSPCNISTLRFHIKTYFNFVLINQINIWVMLCSITAIYQHHPRCEL